MIFKKIKAWWGRVWTAWNETYEKRLCTFITFNAVLWAWCSYILAWFGRYEIAQPLSQTAVTTILGVVISYSVKSLSENISKYGYTGKKPSQADETGEGGAAETGDEPRDAGVYTDFGYDEGFGGKEEDET